MRKSLSFIALALIGAAPSGCAQQMRAGAGRPAAYPTADTAAVLHFLNRLTFGPRPGDIARVQQLGFARWLDTQLSPGRIADPLDRVVRAEYPAAFMAPADAYRAFPPPNPAQQARRDSMMRERAGMMADSMPPRPAPLRQLNGDVAMATLTRHALGERQVQEVMADFWFNHFNVFINKQLTRWSTGDYVERVIRPRALGRFEDLLVAVAEHPAMLVYLDNAQSVAPGARPPQLATAQRFRGRLTPQQRARLEQAQQRMPTGLNENYARELLELHTLGVDGGYTQDDVQEAARILTGWGVRRPGQPQRAMAPGARRGFGQNVRPLDFEYAAWAHDRGAKVVLGETFPAGREQDEGLRLLHLLATHPSTARHISHKLCTRFVNDEAPDGCVDAAVSAWRRTDGNIAEVVRAIVRSEDFWSPANRRAKVKSPLEFVTSAMRAVGARPDSTARLALLLQRLGQPLFSQQVPTGYPETQEDWVNSGALLTRMNTAVAIAAARLPGLIVDLDAVVPLTSDPDRLVAAVNAIILSGAGSPTTLHVIREQVGTVRGPRQMRALAVGLALGSPEFQRQ